MTKNPTAWYPQSGLGYRLQTTSIYWVANDGKQILANDAKAIINNLYYIIGKYATAWTQVG